MLRTTALCGAALACLALAGNAAALTFSFVTEYDTGDFGPDFGGTGDGTPMGVALDAAGNPHVLDSLDDHVYVMDGGGALLNTIDVNPFCAVIATAPPCTGLEEAPLARDLAIAPGGDLWIIDDPSPGGVILNHTASDGVYIEEFGVTSVVLSAGGLAFDPRDGSLLATDVGFDEIVRFGADPTDPLAALTYAIAASSAPTGLIAFDALGTFLVVDGVDGTLYEYSVPLGAGPATFLGETVLTGKDLSTAALLGGAYDASTQRLYLTNDQAGGRLLVYALVPEPGTAGLLALGLFALAVRRRA